MVFVCLTECFTNNMPVLTFMKESVNVKGEVFCWILINFKALLRANF
ncbi:MAG: hypothetical protein K0R59_582 [Sphingobacterium sp.]|jgi:hypothetical protein|nr:hypothetical protein [Sphingobacterium sp.]